MAHQRGLLGGAVVALRALVRLEACVSRSVVVETCSLSEGFAAQLALVRLVTGVDPAVGLQGGVVPEGLAACITDEGPGVGVTPHVGDEGELVSEAVPALLALEGSPAGVLEEVVLQVGLGLEGLITVRTVELADVFVYRVNVGLESALLREVLPAKFTPNL